MNRAALEDLVHALMRAVLLRLARENALRLNAQANPSGAERGEPVQARGREGDPVVGTDGARQPQLTEETRELGGDALRLG